VHVASRIRPPYLIISLTPRVLAATSRVRVTPPHCKDLRSPFRSIPRQYLPFGQNDSEAFRAAAANPIDDR
jgi:hypothetical protein